MQRYFAVLVVLLGLCGAPALAVAGGTDAAPPADADTTTPDAGPATPDAAIADDDAGGIEYPPALDDGEGCDCATGGSGGGLGAAVLLGVVLVGLRRRR